MPRSIAYFGAFGFFLSARLAASLPAFDEIPDLDGAFGVAILQVV
jgi:hypothetical protein